MITSSAKSSHSTAAFQSLSIGSVPGEGREEESVHQDAGRMDMKGMEQEAKLASEN